MHSEFIISPETEIKHKAGCVWDILKWDATKEEIEHEASIYGITYEDCMKWKKHMLRFFERFSAFSAILNGYAPFSKLFLSRFPVQKWVD